MVQDLDEAADTQAPANQPGSVVLTLLPSRLSISPSRVMLNWRLDIANGGESHLVALRIWSDMVSAHSSIPSSEQLGGPDWDDSRQHRLDLIAPGETANIAGEWQMPRDAVRPVDNSPDALILPLARFRLLGAGFAPLRQAFIIGCPPAPGEEKLRALHLEGSLQIHTKLAARSVT